MGALRFIILYKHLMPIGLRLLVRMGYGYVLCVKAFVRSLCFYTQPINKKKDEPHNNSLKESVIRLLSVGVLLFFFGVTLRAQNTKVLISLKDSLKTSISFAYCSIVNANNVIVASSWSDENGNTSFLLPNNNRYTLKIAYFGTLLKEYSFNINKEQDELNLGVFYLNATPKQLNEVVVKGKRMVRKAGNIKMFIKGTSIENIGTLIDVLRETPRIITQGDEITVLGKGTPQIYLNGRKIDDISEILNVKSSEVKTVEVLTNPNGRYGVNATSAIVITTSNYHQDAWGLDFMERMGIYSKSKYANTLNATAHLNYSKISAKIRINHAFTEKAFHKEDVYEYSVSGYDISNRSVAKQNNIQQRLNFSTDVTYRFDDKQSISLYVSLNPTNNNREHLFGKYHHKEQRANDLTESLNSSTKTHSPNILFSGNYQLRKAKTKVDFLGSYFYMNQAANRFLTLNHDVSVFEQSSVAKNLTLKGDCEQKLSKVVNLLSGVEYVYTLRNGIYRSKSSQNDDFKQNQFTGYIALQGHINDNWSFQTQLGLENIDFKYFQNGTMVKEQSRNSLHLLPAISVSYENNNLSLELSYDKSIDKPSYNQLSSNHFMSNKYLRWDGNPALRNSYVHTLSTEIAYDWANLSLSYSRVKDGFFEVCTLLNPESMVIKTSPENLPDYNQFYVGLSVNPQIKKLGILADIGMQLQDLKYNGTSYNKPLFAYSVRLNYALSKDLSLRCGLSGHLKNGSYATGETKGYSNFDIRLVKSWMKGKLITQIYMTDVFKGAYENVALNTNHILRQDYSRGGTKGLFFTIQYKWGKNSKGKDHNLSKEMMRLLPL